jgi:hypothetical protein
MAKSKDVTDIGVAEFKAKCTHLMPKVARTGRTLRVLKRGKVLVEVRPPEPEQPEPFIGRLKGSVTAMGDVVSPIGDDWAADAD